MKQLLFLTAIFLSGCVGVDAQMDAQRLNVERKVLELENLPKRGERRRRFGAREGARASLNVPRTRCSQCTVPGL